MTVDKNLYDAAVELAVARYPTGWSGAAATYTADGRILTSVYVDTPSSGGELCMETGCIL
jgi:cytidine deaminase